MSQKKRSEIKIAIELDENNIPSDMFWTAPDGGIDGAVAKALMLSLWDAQAQESMRIDLWTKDMPVDEMQVFFHQSLVSMSHTYYRATGDEKMKDSMLDFAAYFAEKLELNRKD